MTALVRAAVPFVVASCWLLTVFAGVAQTAPGGEARRIVGVERSGILIDDDGDTPVLSAERGGQVMAARLPAGGAAPAWSPVVGIGDVNARRLIEHRHIYAHGAHWIAFATDRGSFLVKLDRNLRRQALVAVGDPSSPSEGMFIVAEVDGVAVGHALPGVGHRIYRFAADGTPKGTAEVGGGAARHAGGASVLRAEHGYLVVAPQIGQADAPGGVLAIDVDTAWRERSVRFLVAEDGRDIAGPSAVMLGDGAMILHARVRASGAGDGGDIVRYRIDGDGRLRARTVIAPGPKSDRPHTALVRGKLYTLWDTSDAVWMRVEDAP